MQEKGTTQEQSLHTGLSAWTSKKQQLFAFEFRMQQMRASEPSATCRDTTCNFRAQVSHQGAVSVRPRVPSARGCPSACFANCTAPAPGADHSHTAQPPRVHRAFLVG